MRTPLTASLAVALALVAPIAYAAGGAPSRAAGAKLCKAISGPRWSVARGHQTVSGRRYQVGVLNVSCSLAIRHVKKFYGRRSTGAKGLLSGGPSGYVCRSAAPKGLKIFQGTCKRRTGGTTVAAFAWSPKLS